MPTVAECAVVAAPDERFGERACGVLRIRPGAPPPDLEAVQAHLGAVGLPRQKWIEGAADRRRLPPHSPRQDPQVRDPGRAAGKEVMSGPGNRPGPEPLLFTRYGISRTGDPNCRS